MTHSLFIQEENLLGGSVLVSPLVLDLDGDGVETDGFGFFDHAADGSAEFGGWVSEDDGVLAIDLNGNGWIDNGTEVFGNNTVVGEGTAANGFAALSQLDSNSDGVIDCSDADWYKLRIFRWTDSGTGNIFDWYEGRIETLAANNIASLSLSYAASTKVDASGDEHRQVGSYTRTDGLTRDLVDVWFRTVPSIAVSAPIIPGSVGTVTGLPDVPGTGRVPSLSEAMRLDDRGQLTPPFYGTCRTEQRSLRQLVTAFMAAADADGRDELAEKILLRWAGAEAASLRDYHARIQYLAYTTPQNLAVYEAFRGSKWMGGRELRHPDLSSAQEINLKYLNIFESLRAQLLSQTCLKDMFDAVRTFHNGVEVTSETAREDSGLIYTYDYSAVLEVSNAAARRSEFLRSLAALDTSNAKILEALESVSAEWAYEYQYQSSYLANMVSGGFGIYGQVVIGDDTANTFRSTDGTGVYLRGAGGSDIYQLGMGTGADWIEEDYLGNNDGVGLDIVQVAPGIARSSVVHTRTVRDLVIIIVDSEGEATDSLTVKGHYVNDNARIEMVEIGDDTSTTFDLEDFAELPFLQGDGTQGNDTFDASLVSSSLGETQRGGKGSDTYLLGRGTGHEVIDEKHRNHAGSIADSIKLMAGLEITDVKVTRHGLDLRIGLYSSLGILTDSLTVKDHYLDIASRVEFLKASAGSHLLDLSAAGLRTKLQNGVVGGAIEGLGRGHADIFGIDAGSDTFRGRSGDDTYEFGRGSGTDKIEEGHHNHVAGDGADTIRLGAGVSSSMIRLRRTRWDLVVELYDSVLGRVTDSLTVLDHFRHDWAQVERIVLDDGTVFKTSTDFEALMFNGEEFRQSSSPIRGTASGESLYGTEEVVNDEVVSVNDIFDSDAGGNDILYGLDGDDEYRLGSGTGNDEVREGYSYVDGRAVKDNAEVGKTGDLIRIEAGYGAGDVQLRRDNRHLWVELLGTANEQGVRPVTNSLKVVDYYERPAAQVEKVVFADGTVWDSSDFYAVALRCVAGVDSIHGRDDLNDIFDPDAGGDDRLYGYGGDDVYQLGSGTGTDTIYEGSGSNRGEGDAGDLIRIESGFGTDDVRLRRDRDHLWVELLGTAGEDGSRPITDSLKVDSYFVSDASKIEKVEFADGTVWGSAEFHAVALRGSSRNEDIEGRGDLNDIFDSDAGGNDKLYGYAGDDEYRLGRGTGFDEVIEGYKGYVNGHRSSWYYDGDAGDLIRIESGFGVGDVRLRRDTNHLWVDLLGAANENGVRPVTDSLKVLKHYQKEEAKVEIVEFADGTVWGRAELRAAIFRGTPNDDTVTGSNHLNDIFDMDVGGNDKMHGLQGDDEYRLGVGTGFDEVLEDGDDDGDLIRIEAGFDSSDVRLLRDRWNLWIELLGTAGEDGSRLVTDSLKVVDYYRNKAAKVETVEFADGTVWGGDFIVGTAQNDTVTSTVASETLHGGMGDDTYVFSGEFGDDRVVDSSGTDKVQVSGHASSTLSFSREGDDMIMQAIGSDNRITFDHWYAEGAPRKVERIEAGDKVLLSTAAERMATAMATFITGGGTASDFVSRNHLDYWETISGTPGS